MLYVNFFSEGGALLETSPQGDASVPVHLPADAEVVIAGLLTGDDVAAALAPPLTCVGSVDLAVLRGPAAANSVVSQLFLVAERPHSGGWCKLIASPALRGSSHD